MGIRCGRLVLASTALAEDGIGAADQLLFPCVVLCGIDAFDAAQLRYLSPCLHPGKDDPHLVCRGPLTTLLRLTHASSPRETEPVNRNLMKVPFPLTHYTTRPLTFQDARACTIVLRHDRSRC